MPEASCSHLSAIETVKQAQRPGAAFVNSDNELFLA
jgi:hypothetical protein